MDDKTRDMTPEEYEKHQKRRAVFGGLGLSAILLLWFLYYVFSHIPAGK